MQLDNDKGAAAARNVPETRAGGAAPHEQLEVQWREHRRAIWGLSYRMTGSAADADDVLQETFARVLERPAVEDGRPLRPWLVTVAMNLSRDLLRRRRRRAYDGPWLPSPVETGDDGFGTLEIEIEGVGSTEGRYDLLESVSYAFLVALEALTPLARAVLLLRDVFDYSVRETAVMLDTTEGAVKTALHRARRAMRDYDDGRALDGATLRERTNETIERMLATMASGDVEAFASLLVEDCVATTDGGGVYRAARRRIRGARDVARFYLGLMTKLAAAGAALTVERREINGLPALVMRLADPPPGVAPMIVQTIDVGSDGRIRATHTVLAPMKLSAFGDL